ncbi:MAG TPA: tetratricopeptide repeat protein, partial [Candidatus Latescibacteria bacterium]|nr:tetratricopeptide repeat protein [Candidatus Latescibacterota bacterium]
MTKRFLVHPFVMLGLGVLLIVGAGCESVGLRSMKIYIQQRNWEKALEQGNIALAENPNDAEAWFAMAQV